MRQIVVLAGGLATRLYPLTKTIPKSMVKVGGKPFLAHQLDLFKLNGIEEVVLCVGHLSEQIVEYFGDGQKFGIKIQYSQEPERLDTGGPLKNSYPLLDNEFFTIYGDSYLLTDYQKIAEFYHQQKKSGLMTVYRNNNQIEPSRILVDGPYIKKYQKEPPPPRAQHMEWGLNIFKKKVIPRVQEKIFPISHYFDLLSPQKELLAYRVKQRFFEMGSMKGLEEVKKLLSQSKIEELLSKVTRGDMVI